MFQEAEARTMTKQDAAWFDTMYNNRALVPEHGEHLARWAESSAQAREAHACELDIAYGDQPGERLDVFPAATSNGAPVLVFIHGGYWRSLDKNDHSFVAPAFTRDGACVVVPNYALAPAVTVPQITLQMVRALAWTWRNVARFGGDPRRITVAGHSAGGQLAAMMLLCQWNRFANDLPADLVRNALAISALHDLDPLMRTSFLQPTIQLTDAQVAQASPARLPAPPQGTLYSVVGGDESAEYLRQNRLIEERWGAARVPVCEPLPGLNHFSVLEALVEPSHRLHQLALDLLRA
jgi:arylformamidase